MGRFKKLKQRVEVLEFKQKGGNIQHECLGYKGLEYCYNVRFLNTNETNVIQCKVKTNTCHHYLKINGDYIEDLYSLNIFGEKENICAVYKINRDKERLDEVDLDLYKKAYYEKPKTIFEILRGE